LTAHSLRFDESDQDQDIKQELWTDLWVEVEAFESSSLTDSFDLVDELVTTVVSRSGEPFGAKRRPCVRRGEEGVRKTDYLLVRKEPLACMTAREVRFSEAMSSRL
jgi:hypothetical protein